MLATFIGATIGGNRCTGRAWGLARHRRKIFGAHVAFKPFYIEIIV
jgi:hypothetical protein